MLPAARKGLHFKVLVVEDNDDLRDLIAENLRELGHQPVPVSDRASALRTIDEQPIDVLLTDVALPDGSGIALACTISERFPRVPIIVSSGYGATVGGNRVGSAIRPDVLTLPKPLDIDELRHALDQAGAQLER
jgi:DNA-binding NtrC family response regulator